VNKTYELRRARRAVIVLLVALPVMFVAGRATAPRVTVRDLESRPIAGALPSGVERFHDAGEQVTCWRRDTALACLPDRLLAEAAQP